MKATVCLATVRKLETCNKLRSGGLNVSDKVVKVAIWKLCAFYLQVGEMLFIRYCSDVFVGSFDWTKILFTRVCVMQFLLEVGWRNL
jgi:hypothetical protein